MAENDYIAEFKMLYKRRYGVELSRADALDTAYGSNRPHARTQRIHP